MFEVTSLCGQICLGKQGENLARKVYFDEPATWEETFGEGVCELLHQRNGDSTPYPVALDMENGKVCWKITASDTAIVGDGKCELRYIVDDVVVKSKTFTTTVSASLGEEVTEAPEPQQSWVNDVLGAAAKVEGTEKEVLALKEEIDEAYKNAIKTADGIAEEIAQSKETALEEINEAAKDVEEIAIHQPIIVQNNWWVWDAEKKNYVDTGVRAKVDIVQTTGESETDVMSQKATTEALLNLANKVAPSPASVSIYADEWEQDDEEPRWHQVVEVANATITPRSKVDLQPSAEQLTVFYEKSLAFVTENDNGVVTVYCIGQKPENDYTIQVTVSEVVV